MSEEVTTPSEKQAVQLNGLYAFKVGMATVFDDRGESIPVTVLKVESWKVSQVKTKELDGYSAVQIACRPKRAGRTTEAERNHLKGAGFENGAMYVREIRQEIPAGATVGMTVDLETLKKGDKVKVTAPSRGRGFCGVVRRWSFAGGPATHGSGFHRKPGSVGNRTWPGRVMPGKRMAGHYGDETTTVRNIQVVDVIPEESVVLVKGAVPGARNTLVKLMKV